MSEPTLFVKNVCNIYNMLDKQQKFEYFILGLNEFIDRCAKLYIYNPSQEERADIYVYCTPFEIA